MDKGRTLRHGMSLCHGVFLFGIYYPKIHKVRTKLPEDYPGFTNILVEKLTHLVEEVIIYGSLVGRR